MPSVSIDCSDWSSLAVHFSDFFDGLGEVTISESELVFEAGYTGLSVARDGSSRSFMPLHDLAAQWDRIRLDRDERLVVLEGDSVTYTYRVPPELTS